MSFVMKFLNHLVIGVLVSNKKGATNRAIVGVCATLENFAVVVVVVGIDCVVHADDNHLRNLSIKNAIKSK